MEVINPFDFFVEPYADKWPFKFADELHEDLWRLSSSRSRPGRG